MYWHGSWRLAHGCDSGFYAAPDLMMNHGVLAVPSCLWGSSMATARLGTSSRIAKLRSPCRSCLFVAVTQSAEECMMLCVAHLLLRSVASAGLHPASLPSTE